MAGILFYHSQLRLPHTRSAMTDSTLFKYCFRHLSNGKLYVVGAYNRDEAIEMVAEICGDFHFVDTDLPEGHNS